MKHLSRAAAILALLTGCSSEGDTNTATDGGCQRRTWSIPGCEQPSNGCQDEPDACLSIDTFCGCDGVTFPGGCGFATKPFRSTGACADGGP
jgi:hypothetical protein